MNDIKLEGKTNAVASDVQQIIGEVASWLRLNAVRCEIVCQLWWNKELIDV